MKHLRKILCCSSIIGVPLLAASCFHDGSSSSDLNLTFVSLETGQPIAGVTVVLHNADRVTYKTENVKTSGDDGKVRYENLDQNRATYSVIHDGSSDSRDIETYVDFPVGTGVLRLFTEDAITSDCNRAIQVTVNDIPAGTAALDFAPIRAGAGHNNHGTFDTETITETISVCDESVQDDGKISMLASAFNENYETVRYGYLLDQDVGNGGSYSVTLDRVPAAIHWATQPSLPLDYLAVYGMRKGVEFYEGGISSNFEDVKNFGSNGTIMLPTEFPFDRQIVLAGATDGETGRTLLTAVPTLDATIPLTLEFNTALNLADLNYDADKARFTWSTSGSYDLTQLSISSFVLTDTPNSNFEHINWDVILPPDADSWSIPDLPLADDLRETIASDRSMSVTAVDYGAMSSFSELVATIYGASNEVNGFMDIINLLGPVNSASIESETSAAPESVQRRGPTAPTSRLFPSNRPLGVRQPR